MWSVRLIVNVSKPFQVPSPGPPVQGGLPPRLNIIPGRKRRAVPRIRFVREIKGHGISVAVQPRGICWWPKYSPSIQDHGTPFEPHWDGLVYWAFCEHPNLSHMTWFTIKLKVKLDAPFTAIGRKAAKAGISTPFHGTRSPFHGILAPVAS